MNLHIKSLEGGIYLASIEDGERNYYVYDEQNKPKRFNSLNEIKEFLSHDKFEKVWLEQETPYDEMCGLAEDIEKLKMEIEWH
ncbi:MAG: DUF6482 family protein [Aestuariibacter sp.]